MLAVVVNEVDNAEDRLELCCVCGWLPEVVGLKVGRAVEVEEGGMAEDEGGSGLCDPRRGWAGVERMRAVGSTGGRC